MHISNNPELLDRLAAGYALGTLRGGARRRFETLARDNATIRAAALVWQTRWSGLAELQDAVQPPPAVWIRIDNLVQAGKADAAMQAARTAAAAPAPQGWLGSLLLWRSAALAGVVGTVAAVVLGLQAQGTLRHTTGTQIAALQQQLQAAPQIQYVAVLQDAKSSASMLVTFDPKSNQLVLQRVGGFSEGAEKSLQLWAVQPGGGGVRSLGVMGHQAVYTLPAAQADMQGVPALAISLEPLGGVPGEGGPTGPVLFKGELIERTV